MQSALDGRVRGGGAAVPSYPEKDFYFNDFALIANGTTLRSLDGWSAYSSIGSTNAARDLWVIQGGVASAPIVADYGTTPGTFIVGRDSGSTDHVFKATITTLPTSGSLTIAVAATDETNCVMLGIAYNGGSIRDFTFSKRSGGVSTSLVNVTGSNTGLGRNIAVGDRIELSVLGQRLYCRVNDHEITASGGINLDTGGAFVKGTRCGFGTRSCQDTAFDDIYVAPLTAALTMASTQIFWPGSIVTMGRTVPLTGTYTGDVQALDYRVVNSATSATVQDWTRVQTSTIASGSWIASAFVQMCNNVTSPKIRIQVRAANDVDAKIRSGITAVGICIGSYGQSNSFLRGNDGATPYAVANVYSFATSGGTEWRGGTATTGARSQSIAYEVSKASGIPCGIFVGGSGSKQIIELNRRGSGNLVLDEMEADCVTAKAFGYVAIWVWTQAETESGLLTPFVESDYRNEYDLLTSELRAGASGGYQAKFGVCITGQFTGTHVGGTTYGDANWSAVRAGLFRLSDKPGVFIAGNLGATPVEDNIHYKADGYVENGRQLGLSVAKALGYGGHDGRGPLITGATRSGAVITLPVDLNGAASLAGTGLTNYQVSTDDFATTKTISGVAVSGSSIVITLAADPGAPVKVRSFYGMDYGSPVRAIGTYPDGKTIPVEPLYVAITSS